MEKLYSVEEAAEVLRISRYTVQCWLSKGRLMRTKVGRRTLIRASELEKIMEDGQKSSGVKRAKIENSELSAPATGAPLLPIRQQRGPKKQTALQSTYRAGARRTPW